MREPVKRRLGAAARPAVLAFALLVAAMMATGPCVARAEPAPRSAKSRQTLLAADHAFVRSASTADAGATASMLDSRFTWTNRDGKTWTRSQALADWKALAPAVGSESGFVTRLYGRVGVVIGKGSADGHAIRFGRIWIAQPAGWKLIVYQEMPVMPPAPAPPLRSGARPSCVNPCQTTPYEPKTAAVHRVVASWQKLEMSNIERNPQLWAAHVTDDFVLIRPTGQVLHRADRLAQLHREKAHSLVVHVSMAQWLHVWMFGKSALMVAGHRKLDGTRYRATRVWVLRDRVWRLGVSMQTIIR